MEPTDPKPNANASDAPAVNAKAPAAEPVRDFVDGYPPKAERRNCMPAAEPRTTDLVPDDDAIVAARSVANALDAMAAGTAGPISQAGLRLAAVYLRRFAKMEAEVAEYRRSSHGGCDNPDVPMTCQQHPGEPLCPWCRFDSAMEALGVGGEQARAEGTIAAWEEYHRKHASGWDGVVDVEKAIGRDEGDDVEPQEGRSATRGETLPAVTAEQSAARERVLEHLGDAAKVSPGQEAGILAEWREKD